MDFATVMLRNLENSAFQGQRQHKKVLHQHRNVLPERLDSTAISKNKISGMFFVVLSKRDH